MGQKSIKPNTQNTIFYHNEWMDISSQTQGTLPEFGKLKTLQNKNTGDVVDKYQDYFLKQKDYQEYIKSYQWRKQENHIVRGYYIETQNNNKYCSTTYHVVVYIEHPKNRLSDFKDVPFPDTMYVLKAMLTGYAKLFNSVGIFPVKEQQVCIDELGNVKVWLNSNLSKNYPEDWQLQPKIKSQDQEQVEMVSQIVNIVERNSDIQLGPQPSFQQFFENSKRNKKMGFDQTLMLISDYVELHNARVPSYFTSVLQVYQGQDQYNEVGQERSQPSQQSQQSQYQSSVQGSYHSRVSQSHGNTYRSRQSRSSQIQNLDRYRSQINRNRKSTNSNLNKGETYRLSGASKLDQEIAQQNDKNKDKIQVQPGIQAPQLQKNYSDNYLNRISQQSNGNISQASNPNQPRWTTHKPQQPYIPSSPTYLHLQSSNNTNGGGFRNSNSQISSNSDNLYIRKIPQPNQVYYQGQPAQDGMKNSQNSMRGSQSTNKAGSVMRISGTKYNNNQLYGSISQKAEQNNQSYSKQKLLKSQQRDFNNSGSQGYSMRKSHKRSKQNKLSLHEQAGLQLLKESRQKKKSTWFKEPAPGMKMSHAHTNNMERSRSHHSNQPEQLELSKISLSHSNRNNQSVHQQKIRIPSQAETQQRSNQPFGAKPFFISQYSQSPQNHYKNSNFQGNLITQITNQQKTAQFINSGQVISGTQNLHRTNSQISKKSDQVSLEKNNSQKGFTIIIKSPSFNNMSYIPISPTHQQPIFRDSSVNNIKQSPRALIKNNSQPYMMQQNKMISPLIIDNRLNEAKNVSNLPVSPTTIPLNMKPTKVQRTQPIPVYNSTPYQPINHTPTRNQQSSQKMTKKGSGKIQTAYCTIQQQSVQIDPQIANDLLLYV